MAVNQKLENTSKACSAIQPRADHRMGGQVVVDLAGVEAALRQQRTGYRAEREQEQQHQRGAHRGQRAPGIARLLAKQTQKPPRWPILGCFYVWSRTQIGNLTSEHERVPQPRDEVVPDAGDQRRADRDQQGAAEDLDAPAVPPQPAQARHRPRRTERQQHERDPQPHAVGDRQNDSARHVGALGGRGDGDHPAQRRPQARRPAEREHRAEHRCPGYRRQLARAEPGLTLQGRDRARRTPAP